MLYYDFTKKTLQVSISLTSGIKTNGSVWYGVVAQTRTKVLVRRDKKGNTSLSCVWRTYLAMHVCWREDYCGYSASFRVIMGPWSLASLVRDMWGLSPCSRRFPITGKGFGSGGNPYLSLNYNFPEVNRNLSQRKKVKYYYCKNYGHYKPKCPKLKNKKVIRKVSLLWLVLLKKNAKVHNLSFQLLFMMAILTKCGSWILYVLFICPLKGISLLQWAS
jgi:hypothetical protein